MESLCCIALHPFGPKQPLHLVRPCTKEVASRRATRPSRPQGFGLRVYWVEGLGFI